ncbi:MAG: sugar ABC transporter substrate-binding protein [Solirubrobacterales bacterium]
MGKRNVPSGPSNKVDPRVVAESYTRRVMLTRASAVAGGLTVLPAVLAACGSSGSSSTAATTGGATTSGGGESGSFGSLSTNPTKISGFQPFDSSVAPGPETGLPTHIATNFPAGSEYFDNFAKNVEKAVKDRGLEFSSTTWESDVAQNIAQLKQLQTTGVGSIIAQVQDEHGESATLLEAIKAGICVVYSVAGPSTLQIITDQYKGGLTQGEQAAKWIEENLGGQAQVVVFNDDQIAEALIPRAEGRVAGVEKAGSGVKIVANQPIKQLTAQEGNELASTLLQAHPDANVWMADDDTALGVVSALEAAGKTPDDKIYVSGFNGEPKALDAVKAGGLLREDIAFPNAVYEYAVGQFCCDWIEGKSIPSVVDLKTQVVTPENVDAVLANEANPASVFEGSEIDQLLGFYGNTSFAEPSYTPSGITSE